MRGGGVGGVEEGRGGVSALWVGHHDPESLQSPRFLASRLNSFLSHFQFLMLKSQSTRYFVCEPCSF